MIKTVSKLTLGKTSCSYAFIVPIGIAIVLLLAMVGPVNGDGAFSSLGSGSLTGNAASVDSFAVYNGNLYAGTGDGVWEWSDAAWTQVGSSSPLGSDVTSLAVYNGYLCAGTTTVGVMALSSDGTRWDQVGGSSLTDVLSLTVYNGNLYAGTTTDGVWELSGTTWTQVGSLTGNIMVQSLTVYNGNLFAATQGGVWEWSGTTWWQIGLVPGGHASSLTVYNGNLYVGTFGEGVFEWSGTTWTQVGSLTGNQDAFITSLTVYNGNLYAGTGDGVWEWGGTTWTQVGSLTGSAAYVMSLAGYNGNLYAGTTDGVFELSNNVPPPPSFTSGATNTAGTAINITFNKAMANPTGDQAQFNYSINGGPAQPFSAAAIDPSNPDNITLKTSGTSIVNGNTVTVNYTAGTVKSADGGVLATFNNKPVTNNVPAPIKVGAHSPVYMTVSDPNGNSISCSGNPASVTNTILPANTATYTGCSADPTVDGTVTIPFPIPGNYQVAVTPKPGASPSSVYTITLTQGVVTTTLASGVPVSNIPSTPYQNVVTSSGSIGTTPTITWSKPANITYGTRLSGTQLDATANVAGTFAYTPAAGSILNAGTCQTLSTLFMPTDKTDYNTASANVMINVDPAPTTTKVSSSANPSVWGQSVTFTATVAAVSPGTGTPTGTVKFMDGTASLGSSPVSSGQAKFTPTSLSVGSHSITAVYSGDRNFTTSTNSTLSQKVNKALTTTTVTAAPNPSTLGQSVTLTAAIAVTAPGAGTPTGTVAFVDGTTSLGTGTVTAGKATLSTTKLPAGMNSITATYSGDGNFLTSSGTVSENVIVPIQITFVPPAVVLGDGYYLLAYITLPNGFSAKNVDPASVQCSGAVATQVTPSTDIPQAFGAIFPASGFKGVKPGNNVPFIITGNLKGNIQFAGTSTASVTNV
jgi:hypothetical protein